MDTGKNKEIDIYHLQETGISIPVAKIKGAMSGGTAMVSIGFNESLDIAIAKFLLIVEEIVPSKIKGEMILVPYINDAATQAYRGSRQSAKEFRMKQLFDQTFLNTVDSFWNFQANDFFDDLSNTDVFEPFS